MKMNFLKRDKLIYCILISFLVGVTFFLIFNSDLHNIKIYAAGTTTTTECQFCGHFACVGSSCSYVGGCCPRVDECVASSECYVPPPPGPSKECTYSACDTINGGCITVKYTSDTGVCDRVDACSGGVCKDFKYCATTFCGENGSCQSRTSLILKNENCDPGYCDPVACSQLHYQCTVGHCIMNAGGLSCVVENVKFDPSTGCPASYCWSTSDCTGGGGTTVPTSRPTTTTTTTTKPPGTTTTSTLPPPTTSPSTTSTLPPPPPPSTCQILDFKINDKDNTIQDPLIVWVNASLTGYFSVNDTCKTCTVTSNDNWNGTYPISTLKSSYTESFKITTAGTYSYTLECVGTDPKDIVTDTLSLQTVKAMNLPWWREIIPNLLPFLRGMIR